MRTIITMTLFLLAVSVPAQAQFSGAGGIQPRTIGQSSARSSNGVSASAELAQAQAAVERDRQSVAEAKARLAAAKRIAREKELAPRAAARPDASGHVTQADLDYGIELIREDRRRIQEDTRLTEEVTIALKAFNASQEKLLSLLEKRAEETTRCRNVVEKYLMKIKSTYSSEEFQVQGRLIIDKYKLYVRNPDLPCPL